VNHLNFTLPPWPLHPFKSQGWINQ
jgi:hypothetical protein